MVLVGKRGVGKSATGNTIAGEDVFTEDICGRSVTSKCTQHSFERDGYELQLVDTRGFFDTNMSAEDIRKGVGQCVALSSPGIHAILFIIHVNRFTDEDTKTIEAFIACFGEECRKYVQVIFTGKDRLNKGKKTIDEFVRTSPESLKMFLSTVQGRYMAVNNNDMSPDKKTFTKELVVRISQMVQANGGMCYTNDMYRKAEIQLQQAEDEVMKKIAAKAIEKERAQIEEKLRKQLLSEEEHALEDDRRNKARKRQRSRTGIGFRGFMVSLFGIPAAVAGFCFGGPAGAVGGAAAGAALGGFLGGTIGENISD